MTASVSVVHELGVVVVQDERESVEIDAADVPRIAAELLVALDRLESPPPP